MNSHNPPDMKAHEQKIIFSVVKTLEDLQKAFFVRNIVFVAEQQCPYSEEFDGNDLSATHFIAMDGDEPVAVARIRFCKGGIKIERMAVRKEWRGRSVARELFSYVLKYSENLGAMKFMLHSQAYVTGFYEKFGFIKKGELFTEAGIGHYYMEKLK